MGVPVFALLGMSSSRDAVVMDTEQDNQMKLINIVKSALSPGNFIVMSKKVVRRIKDRHGTISIEENRAWLHSHGLPFEAIVSSLDPQLWEETKEFERRLKAHAKTILGAINYDLGGGGCYPLLYFLTRYLKPACVVETGVAAGFSSCAFLEAIDKNGKGKLYSSDFPYFRLPNPEKYIGILVEERLRNNWELLIRGDEENLPIIVGSVESIDIFHYDSDKSHSGRKLALDLVTPNLSKNAILIFDDIQDNAFFYDHIARNNITAWRVINFENKYLGIIGEIQSDLFAGKPPQ